MVGVINEEEQVRPVPAKLISPITGVIGPQLIKPIMIKLIKHNPRYGHVAFATGEQAENTVRLMHNRL